MSASKEFRINFGQVQILAASGPLQTCRIGKMREVQIDVSTEIHGSVQVSYPSSSLVAISVCISS